ncbi:MAG: nucleotidyltransferase substrate binding protein [Elusimicrobia bacterium]|nr:nucleotidyltransferase substrate binding protein [Elusimicrobiota bacterium]
MKEELDYALNKFKNALKSLNEGIVRARDELDKDGVIQRFEFTFEQFWKYLKYFLEDKGFDAKSPKDCLGLTFRLGFIKDEKVFLDMLEDRNKTSHLYDEEESEEIYRKIKKIYLPHLKEIFKKLTKDRER